MADTDRFGVDAGAFGDAAVDGLIAGGLAGIPMAAFLVVAGLARGEAVAAVLGRFDPGAAASPVTGALVHLAVAGVYGLLYGLARRGLEASRRLRRLPGWLTGPAFGLLIWVAAHTLLLPGANSPLRQVAPLLFLVAHVIYGLGLGLAYRRRQGVLIVP